MQNYSIYKNNFKASFSLSRSLDFCFDKCYFPIIQIIQSNHCKVPEILCVNYYNLSSAGIATTNNPA